MNFKSILIGFSAGAIVMLLYAPKSGKDTRKYLKRRVDKGTQYIERGIANVQDISDDVCVRSKKLMKQANSALAVAANAGKYVTSAIL